MISKRDQKQSSSLNERIRDAGFVNIPEPKKRRFINKFPHSSSKYFRKYFLKFKRWGNLAVQTPKLWLTKLDWEEIKKESLIWFTNVMLEGVILNFAVWAILGWEFSLRMTIACGIVIVKGIDIFWRLRQNGRHTKIPNKHKE